MIRCLVKDLQERCDERGYSYDDVQECIVSQQGNVLVVDEMHPSYPRQRISGLGDLVAKGLRFVGITPERVSKLTGRPCKCKSRQQALNKFGRRIGIGRP